MISYNNSIDQYNYYVANNHNHSDTISYTKDDFTVDNMNAANPYTKMVVGSIRMDSSIKYRSNGTKYTSVTYHTNYVVNEAYKKYESLAYNFQKEDLNKKLSASTKTYNETILSEAKDTAENYGDILFGNANEINSLNKEIYENKYKINTAKYLDEHTDEYNRIKNTNYEDVIDAVEKIVEADKTSIKSYEDAYNADKKEKIARKEKYDAMDYDHSDTNEYSTIDIIKSDINMDNPYDESVVTGVDKSLTVHYEDGSTKNISSESEMFLLDHTGVVSIDDNYELVYGTNSAYTSFEENISSAQEFDYNREYNDKLFHYKNDLSVSLEDIDDNYDTDRFGDTDGIKDLQDKANEIKLDIFAKNFEDEYTNKYNRIDNSDNSLYVEAQNEDLSIVLTELKYKKDLYDNKEFQDKLKQIKDEMAGEDGEWKFDIPNWVPPPPPRELIYKPIEQDSISHIILNTTGEINRWMPGGDLYDAPRAGDVLFNVAGDLNTVRFLGLQDSNSTPDLVQRFVNPNISSMFGPMAGDDNFSVIR